MITKRDAVDLFGGKAKDLANVLGTSKSAISQWPEILSQDQTNIVIGEAVRRRIKIPENMLSS